MTFQFALDPLCTEIALSQRFDPALLKFTDLSVW